MYNLNRIKVVYTTPAVQSGMRWVGIQRRLDAMLKAWSELGVDGVVVPWPGARERAFRPRWRSALRTLSAGHTLLREIKRHEPDVVIARCNIWMPWLWSLGSGDWVLIGESHGTDPGRQQALYQAGITAIEKRAAAMMYVTAEIAETCPSGVPYFLTGNSSDMKPLPAPSNQRPVVMFAPGHDMPYQGVDIFLDAAARCPELDFLLVIPDDVKLGRAEMPTNLDRVAAHSSEDLVRHMSRADIAVGTLAAHRWLAGPDGRSMPLSPMKVRDALASAIPTLVVNRDPLVEGLNDPLVFYRPDLDGDVEGIASALPSLARSAVGSRLHAETSFVASTLEHERRRVLFIRSLIEGTLGR